MRTLFLAGLWAGFVVFAEKLFGSWLRSREVERWRAEVRTMKARAQTGSELEALFRDEIWRGDPPARKVPVFYQGRVPAELFDPDRRKA